VHDLGHVIEQFSYPAVVLLCWACGLGAPLSEDLIILAGGALVARGASFPLMALSAFIGQLGGDFLLFSMGRRWGPKALNLPGLKSLMTPERVRRMEERFAKQGNLLVVLARFMPGMRTPTYLIAGLSQWPQGRFLGVDTVAAAVSAPLVTYLGYRFGPPLFQLVQPIARGAGLTFVALGLAFYLARRWRIARALRLTPSPVQTLP
jgi:membrane protein DedA with SNARE-associated domain